MPGLGLLKRHSFFLQNQVAQLFFTNTTVQGPAKTRVTGTTSPVGKNTCVIAIFFPKMNFIVFLSLLASPRRSLGRIRTRTKWAACAEASASRAR